jgi:hypothetical protein
MPEEKTNWPKWLDTTPKKVLALVTAYFIGGAIYNEIEPPIGNKGAIKKVADDGAEKKDTLIENAEAEEELPPREIEGTSALSSLIAEPYLDLLPPYGTLSDKTLDLYIKCVVVEILCDLKGNIHDVLSNLRPEELHEYLMEYKQEIRQSIKKYELDLKNLEDVQGWTLMGLASDRDEVMKMGVDLQMASSRYYSDQMVYAFLKQVSLEKLSSLDKVLDTSDKNVKSIRGYYSSTTLNMLSTQAKANPAINISIESVGFDIANLPAEKNSNLEEKTQKEAPLGHATIILTGPDGEKVNQHIVPIHTWNLESLRILHKLHSVKPIEAPSNIAR